MRKFKYEIFLAIWFFIIILMFIAWLVFLDALSVSDGLTAIQCIIEILGLSGLGFAAFEYLRSIQTPNLEIFITQFGINQIFSRDLHFESVTIDASHRNGPINILYIDKATINYNFELNIINNGPVPANFIKAVVLVTQLDSNNKSIVSSEAKVSLINGIYESYWSTPGPEFGRIGNPQRFYGKEEVVIFSEETTEFEDISFGEEIGKFNISITTDFSPKSINVGFSVQALRVSKVYKSMKLLIPTKEEVRKKAIADNAIPPI